MCDHCALPGRDRQLRRGIRRRVPSLQLIVASRHGLRPPPGHARRLGSSGYAGPRPTRHGPRVLENAVCAIYNLCMWCPAHASLETGALDNGWTTSAGGSPRAAALQTSGSAEWPPGRGQAPLESMRLFPALRVIVAAASRHRPATSAGFRRLWWHAPTWTPSAMRGRRGWWVISTVAGALRAATSILF